MSDHSPEPWYYHQTHKVEGHPIGEIHGEVPAGKFKDGTPAIGTVRLASAMREVDAKRIVACVNVCKGIKTKALIECCECESGVFVEVLKSIETANTVLELAIDLLSRSSHKMGPKDQKAFEFIIDHFQMVRDKTDCSAPTLLRKAIEK